MPGRYRRYYMRWHHHKIFIPREKRQLANFDTGITKVVTGAVETGTGQYCVFVLYPPAGQIQSNVMRAIDAMQANGINVVACLNAPLSDDAMRRLENKVQIIILRNNVGYDFGAYKDCVKYLTSSFPDLKRVMMLNDSVFFIEKGLREFFGNMMANYDSVAAFENWGDSSESHFQSFAISVSRNVFFSGPFQQFWTAYLPVSSRLFAIEEGEKKLSGAILQSAESSHVLYTCDKLRERLASLDEDLICDDTVVPVRYRGLLPVDESRTFALNKHYLDVIDIVCNSSPVHTGAWLFPRFLEAPLIKKDIVYRQRFQFWEVQALFAELLAEEEAAEFFTMLRAKGNHEKLDPVGLARYQLGIG